MIFGDMVVVAASSLGVLSLKSISFPRSILTSLL